MRRIFTHFIITISLVLTAFTFFGYLPELPVATKPADIHFVKTVDQNPAFRGNETNNFIRIILKRSHNAVTILKKYDDSRKRYSAMYLDEIQKVRFISLEPIGENDFEKDSYRNLNLKIELDGKVIFEKPIYELIPEKPKRKTKIAYIPEEISKYDNFERVTFSVYYNNQTEITKKQIAARVSDFDFKVRAVLTLDEAVDRQ